MISPSKVPYLKMPVHLRKFSEMPSGCWQWNGCLDEKGYGRVGIGGKARKAHRSGRG